MLIRRRRRILIILLFSLVLFISIFIISVATQIFGGKVLEKQLILQEVIYSFSVAFITIIKKIMHNIG